LLLRKDPDAFRAAPAINDMVISPTRATGIQEEGGGELKTQLHVDMKRWTLTEPQSKQRDYKVTRSLSPTKRPCLQLGEDRTLCFD
jgi:hypothetical protein